MIGRRGLSLRGSSLLSIKEIVFWEVVLSTNLLHKPLAVALVPTLRVRMDRGSSVTTQSIVTRGDVDF